MQFWWEMHDKHEQSLVRFKRFDTDEDYYHTAKIYDNQIDEEESIGEGKTRKRKSKSNGGVRF